VPDPSTAPTPLVLIVDDDPDGRTMYAQMLDSSGFRVEEASDGFEAVDKGYKLRPNLILMDLLMPRLDGWEVVGWLRKNGVTRDIPIVVITGGQQEYRELALSAGAHSVLVKPCAPDRVLAHVRKVLSATRQTA
jgi:CheY-like chemotaxis protein